MRKRCATRGHDVFGLAEISGVSTDINAKISCSDTIFKHFKHRTFSASCTVKRQNASPNRSLKCSGRGSEDRKE
jgi:hypothetical protein